MAAAEDAPPFEPVLLWLSRRIRETLESFHPSPPKHKAAERRFRERRMGWQYRKPVPWDIQRFNEGRFGGDYRPTGAMSTDFVDALTALCLNFHVLFQDVISQCEWLLPRRTAWLK